MTATATLSLPLNLREIHFRIFTLIHGVELSVKDFRNSNNVESTVHLNEG